MCGIIGYRGKKNAISVVVNGLKNLEYRGYDSSGVAYLFDSKIRIVKKEGKISNLESILPNEESHMAIGHTRWATHGEANTVNAHPHKVGSVTLVHNGIIENYQELRDMLLKEGYSFKSETDTEILAGVIDYYFKMDKDMVVTLNRLDKLIRGSYAIGIMVDGIDKIYAVRKRSPLIVGILDDGYTIASDVPAILEYTRKYFLLDEGEICVIDDEVNVYKDNTLVKKDILEFTLDIGSAKKDGYDHFMLKEIYEQPAVIRNLINIISARDVIDLRKYDEIQIVGCGSAYHAGMVGKYLIERFLNIRCSVYIASEYRYGDIFYSDKTLFIAISQSGETADTLASLLLAKERGMYTLSIINTVGSSIARESDEVLYINAGMELAVATTKAYSLQVLVFALLVSRCMEDSDLITNELKKLPDDLLEPLNYDYKNLANTLKDKNDIFFLGRLVDYAVCLEGSLKLKEISYIHSEAYAAGELKHGTISLIEEGTPVIAVVSDERVYEKTISNIKEVKSRGAYVILLVSSDINISSDIYDEVIRVKRRSMFTQPLIIMVYLQLISYYVALYRGCDIDKPKNLAKSVTVE